MKFEPHSYQMRAIDFIMNHKSAGLFLDMGLGKTVITLTAIERLIFNFEVSKVLVIAPKRVAEDTWTREHAKWDHLKDLRISKVLGPPAKRENALAVDADIYVTSRDMVVWLVKYYDRHWPFDMVVIDELSSFKSPSAKRFRALRRVVPDRVVGLTGTPSANGLIDLWAEMYLLDQGERLGKTFGSYRNAYFRPGARNDKIVFRWDPVPGAARQIEDKIRDICLSMNAEDYLTMPERVDNLINVQLTEKERNLYNRMEREQLLQLDEGDVVALSPAAVMNKLLQIANGCVYDAEGKVLQIHRQKLDALLDILELSPTPVLVFYCYKHDLAAIREAVPDARTIESEKDISDWNDGTIRLLLCHPASVGYGLNLQDGGHTIVWYGLIWSLELYQQANARLYRQGQQKTVVIHHLITEGTVDEQVMRALKKKDTSQAALLASLKERRQA